MGCNLALAPDICQEVLELLVGHGNQDQELQVVGHGNQDQELQVVDPRILL